MSSLKTLREILDQKISDKKQLDIKTWKKAINIATSKSKKIPIKGMAIATGGINLIDR